MVQFLLFHLLICLEQLRRERTLDTDKHVLNAGCLYAGLPLKYKSGVLLEQCCDIHATNTAFFLHATQSATIYCKQEKGGKEKAWVQRSPSSLFFTLSFLSVFVFSLTKSVIWFHSLTQIWDTDFWVEWLHPIAWEMTSLLKTKLKKNNKIKYNFFLFYIVKIISMLETFFGEVWNYPDYRGHLTDWYLIYFFSALSKHTL